MARAARFHVTEIDGMIYLKDQGEILRFDEIDNDGFAFGAIELRKIQRTRQNFNFVADYLNSLMAQDKTTFEKFLGFVTYGEEPSNTILHQSGPFALINHKDSYTTGQLMVTMKTDAGYEAIWVYPKTEQIKEISFLETAKERTEQLGAAAQLLKSEQILKKLKRNFEALKIEIKLNDVFPAIGQIGKPPSLLDKESVFAKTVSEISRRSAN